MARDVVQEDGSNTDLAGKEAEPLPRGPEVVKSNKTRTTSPGLGGKESFSGTVG